MKKFASSRSLNKILAQCDSSSREYEEIQAVERRWHLHLATPRCLPLDRRAKASLFFAAPPPPKRAPSTTLTLRSKSMTAELEELGEQQGRMAGGQPQREARRCELGPEPGRERGEEGQTDKLATVRGKGVGAEALGGGMTRGWHEGWRLTGSRPGQTVREQDLAFRWVCVHVPLLPPAGLDRYISSRGGKSRGQGTWAPSGRCWHRLRGLLLLAARLAPVHS